MFPRELEKISSEKFVQLLPKLLSLTMSSFRKKDRKNLDKCIIEIERIQNFFTQRTEKAFQEYIDPDSNTTLEVKMSVIQILLYEINQIIHEIKEFMQVKISGNKFLQYPIPVTINFLFYFLEKDKILKEILKFYHKQQEEEFNEQINHIHSSVQDVYQLNETKIRVQAEHSSKIISQKIHKNENFTSNSHQKI
ncbi:MAG: hypothetical protein K9W44_06015 [Candidatus Lokiarchaeota archaeon]|nr:hypothetical protein [Candidatus Harpocratesius repetitus]